MSGSFREGGVGGGRSSGSGSGRRETMGPSLDADESLGIRTLAPLVYVQDIYARKADIIVRGYAGWNSRQAVEVLDHVFPKDKPVQPSLVIVYFGGNDSVLPTPDGLSPHVPLSEYVENMRKIAIHLKSLSEKRRIIFLMAPPVNEAQILQVLGTKGCTNELCKKYADACVKLCREMNIKSINLCTALKQRDDWMTTCFTDGIHLSPVGSKIVAKEILKVIMEAD